MSSDPPPMDQGRPATGTATLADDAPASADGGWQPVQGPESHDLAEHAFRKLTGDERQIAQRSLIDASARILSRCTDPDCAKRHDTGLVIGYVQSGKTLSFTTVAALARDNRFHMVIVMTGISIPLYDQSSGRLRGDLRLDTPRDRKWMMFTNPRSTDARPLQDLLRDWRDDATPPEQKMTALIAVMKNHRHLRNLNTLLRESISAARRSSSSTTKPTRRA